jgi:hypothetical protein
MHGGATPAGVASPHYIHGKRSKYLKDLPKDLKAGYKAALNDPDLTALNGELALLEGRIGQLLRKLRETEAPTWTQALATLADLDAVVHEGDLDRIEQVLDQHAAVVRSGADAARAQARTWRELMETIALKTRTAQAETKRLHDARAFVTVEHALLLVGAMVEAARDVVKDEDVLRRLQQRLVVLLPPASE